MAFARRPPADGVPGVPLDDHEREEYVGQEAEPLLAPAHLAPALRDGTSRLTPMPDARACRRTSRA
ncbi:hypothetical protein [Streptomyces sp. E2N166]|uniref:hypothetical protein n=1 Tax=Streptomyces sp. E2N166 TaxID=1851909 RepID=UPI000EF701C0|nr:hypothetical protein [Streptomyces sp. E2N166]